MIEYDFMFNVQKTPISIIKLLFDFQQMIVRQLIEVFSFLAVPKWLKLQTIFILCSQLFSRFELNENARVFASHLTINSKIAIIIIGRKSYLKPGVLLIEAQT